MFDFLKRKKTPEVPTAAPPATPAAPTDAGETPALPAVPTPPKASWRERLTAGLTLSRDKLANALGNVLSRRTLDDDTLEELETALLTADTGVAATAHLLAELKQRYAKADAETDVKTVLRDALYDLLRPLQTENRAADISPQVVMLAGVNGAGKTTSIGKLTRRWQNEGHTVLLAAGDTFRAAAGEQLSVWGERNNVTVIAQQGGDPAAVMFDAIQAARARGIDIVLADTAGRLPTQTHLMEELKKIKRVIGRAQEGAPHEVLLVLDANTGQNGLAQVKAFDAAIGLTGLIVTKLDGSAKGGVLAAIAREHPIPVRFIGVGESIDDLQPFDAREFVEALLP
ncbi:MAG: signal recognition particle-docking protein FtsY [Proteobacteria bacterium]|nr:signal recognition particle-docking protein FtsY [Pseudomonadota bacterium]MCL2307886.1 signal recognition particle-docking protein FtsY [Pseudomonadota bacterium]